MNILKIIKTNGKEFPIEKFNECKNHYYIYFKCKNCGREDKKQFRRFTEDLCRKCLKEKTTLEKYGVTHTSKTNKVKKKISNASKKNNNIQFTLNSINEEIIKKRQITKRNNLLPILEKKLLKYNLQPLFNNNYIGQRINNETIKYTFKCLLCNNIFKGTLNGHIPKCPICYPKGSFKQKEVSFFIENLGFKIIENTREIISPYELDIYIPSKNLAIEFDGIYWHSFKDKYYHLNKTKMCEKKGIKLIHIFENEWGKQIKNFLISNLFEQTIKNYEIKKVDNNIEFQKEYSLFNIIETNNNFGLFINNELVSLICIDKNEIKCYCYYKYNGLKYLLNDYKIKLDRRYFSILDFNTNKFEKPKKIYYKNNNIINEKNEIFLYDCGSLILNG